ncbi:MAG: 3D domain-containing protein [Candidatus Kerfeldbacteria bacterium]|nr:3D domain-containing protein [Candidatus Kerfeldbacteria bacterium]
MRPARYVTRVTTTAYSSTPDQTDATPFITANGTSVRHGLVAANFLPFGTHVRLPDYFGEEVFVVEDRMNERYDYRLDIWMATREQARNWGVRQVRLEVL